LAFCVLQTTPRTRFSKFIGVRFSVQRHYSLALRESEPIKCDYAGGLQTDLLEGGFRKVVFCWRSVCAPFHVLQTDRRTDGHAAVALSLISS